MTTTPLWAESRKRSVDNLQRIYTFVVSLAVAEALRRVLTDLPNAPSLEVWMRLVITVVTVIPFYHGANRYLDAAYVTGERSSVRYALMVDFLFLFFEGILFFVLSLVIREADWFYIVFVVLLSIDIIWVITTTFTTRSESQSDTGTPGIGTWALINVVCIFLVLFVHWASVFPVTVWKYSFAQPTFFCGLAVLRSFFDYYFLWAFYYPEAMVAESAAASRGKIALPTPTPPSVQAPEPTLK